MRASDGVVQWFSTFFIPRTPLTVIHGYNPPLEI